MRFLLYLGDAPIDISRRVRHYWNSFVIISIYVYIRLFESNGLIQTSNGVATLVKHFHQNQYQTLSLVNFVDGSVVLLIESSKKLTVVLLYSDVFEERFK